MPKSVVMCSTLTELFEDKSRWTQGTMARDTNGKMLPSEDPSAVCWCLLGGLDKVYKDFVTKTAAYKKISDRVGNLNTFNDRNSYETIYQLVKELGI